MNALKEAISATPIIDHHAHNLLIDVRSNAYNFLSITSEASSQALQDSTSSLAHLRAVKQLSQILGCEPTWQEVKKAIDVKRLEPDDAWSKECFAGIETALIDDGLDPSNIYGYRWHDRLTRSKCKRIVRIERVAEKIISNAISYRRGNASNIRRNAQRTVLNEFMSEIEEAILDPDVAGFKSVICYRTGLRIPGFDAQDENKLGDILEDATIESFSRLEHEQLNPYFVHITAQTIVRRNSKKPLQFHTGLGDNDIDLFLSNSSHLQSFIETYPELSIVLLHASYPFTKEAGYLASVYKNCYLDIGEVFPFLSQDGQERVIRDALDLCPSQKLLWSTDGHWFPETYLLAVIQVKEGLEKVLKDYVERAVLNIEESIQIIRDIFFNTANQLYDLHLQMTPASSVKIKQHISRTTPQSGLVNNLSQFEQFLSQTPSVNYLRLQWLDYTATLRVRILPVKQALRLFRHGKTIGITKAVLGLLQTDETSPWFSATGEHKLCPDFGSLRLSSRTGYATVQCEFRKEDGSEVEICPRTILQRQLRAAKEKSISFLVGFEIEVIFIRKQILDGQFEYGGSPINEGGHAWSTARALHNDRIMDLLEAIIAKLEQAGIEVQQFHPESAPGQYEFVLGPLQPLDAVDTLLAAREIISAVAASANLHATLYPRPFPTSCGNGAHIHISVTPDDKWPSFFAGILNNLGAMSAILYSNDASYERVADGIWCGSTWIAWGPQNRETPVRQVENSHFEIKCVDGFANPYLALASIIGAGVQGILRNMPLQTQPCLVDPASLKDAERKALGIREQFPKNFTEAAQRLRASLDMADILSPNVVQTYLTIKEAEWRMLEKMGPARRRNWLIERY